MFSSPKGTRSPYFVVKVRPCEKVTLVLAATDETMEIRRIAAIDTRCLKFSIIAYYIPTATVGMVLSARSY